GSLKSLYRGKIGAENRSFWSSRHSEPDPLDLLLGKALLRSVVQLRRTRAFVRRHLLRMLERTAVGEVSGDPGGAEGVAANFRPAAGHRRAASDRPPGVDPVHGGLGKHAGAPSRRAK